MYVVENCPQIKNNFFLKARNIGASRKLKGNIMLMVCFMKRTPAEFSVLTERNFFTALNEACRWLTAEAKRYGARLDIRYTQFTIDVPKDADPRSAYGLVREYFDSNTINMDQLQMRYEKRMNVDEAPFVFVFDEVARSFAKKQAVASRVDNEASIIFKDTASAFSWSTIAHELLHQFGAIDYYYPRAVTELAQRYIKNSIMGIGRRNVLDDLSAYLVGIKDTISADTYYFLKDTMWMDLEQYDRSIEESWGIRRDKQATQQADNSNQPKFKPIHAKEKGRIGKICVSVGQIVKTGDVLMTTGSGAGDVVRAVVSGRVERITVKAGETVEHGTLLAVIARV